MAELITLVWGLPGSGKTTWAESQSADRIDMDYLMRQGDTKNSSTPLLKGEKLIAAVVEMAAMVESKHIIIDGLILTNAFAQRLMTSLFERCGQPKFAIHWWEPDRITCLWNDEGRRAISAHQTIMKAPFENPNKELLERFGIPRKRCVKHVPVKKVKDFVNTTTPEVV